MKRCFFLLAASIVLVGNAANAVAGTVIGDLNDPIGLSNHGVSPGATSQILVEANGVGSAVGQTFKLGTGGNFSDLTFTLSLQNATMHNTVPTTTTYSAYLQAWDSTNFTTMGLPLGNSGQNHSMSDFQGITQQLAFDTITFDMGPVQLPAGKYVIYLKANNSTPAAPNGNMIAAVESYTGQSKVPNPYTDGQLVEFDGLSGSWGPMNESRPFEDLAFDVALTPASTPEPSSAILLGFGIASMGVFGWRMRRKPILAV